MKLKALLEAETSFKKAFLKLQQLAIDADCDAKVTENYLTITPSKELADKLYDDYEIVYGQRSGRRDLSDFELEHDQIYIELSIEDDHISLTGPMDFCDEYYLGELDELEAEVSDWLDGSAL